jgi:hypothetical protein
VAVVAQQAAVEVARLAAEEDAPVAVVAAAADVDKQTPTGVIPMKAKSHILTSMKLITSTIFVSSFMTLALQAEPAAKPEAATTPQAKQLAFDTPQLAVDRLLQAAEACDVPALKEILGPDSEDLISSEDPVKDKQRLTEFVSLAKEKNSIAVDPKKSSRAILSVGNDEFPLPIPVVKHKEKWSFDTKAGRDEILKRRIGANELDAIEVSRGFVEAQQEYAQEKHDDSQVNQYAQHIISTPGKHDGLSWKNEDGTWGGPVGESIAKALEQGYTSKDQPYHGYHFKVLKGQGPAAPLGEMDFVVEGAMIGGFALAAAPAQYRVTGVKTFVVGPDGTVYEKDLGADTQKSFEAMDRFNPDKTWKPTGDQW